MAYMWNPSMPRPVIDAEVFGKTCERLGRGDIGAVTADDIVNEVVGNPDSPLRPGFCWDKDVAHQLVLKDQAQGYLRGLQLVRVTTEDGPSIGERAFHAVSLTTKLDGLNGRAYAPVDAILSSEHLTRQWYESALGYLQAGLRKYARVMATSAAAPLLEDAVRTLQEEISEIDIVAKGGVGRKSRRKRRGDGDQPPSPPPA